MTTKSCKGQARDSVDQLGGLFDRFENERIVRAKLERGAEMLQGLARHRLGEINARQVQVREVSRIVTLRRDRFLEPRDGGVQLARRDQIRSDIVVRVAEIGIEIDCLLAELD